MAGSLIRHALHYQHEHPALTDRLHLYLERSLDALIAIAARVGVPSGEVPAPLPSYDRLWLGDLIDAGQLEAAEAEAVRRKDPKYSWNSYGKG